MASGLVAENGFAKSVQPVPFRIVKGAFVRLFTPDLREHEKPGPVVLPLSRADSFVGATGWLILSKRSLLHGGSLLEPPVLVSNAFKHKESGGLDCSKPPLVVWACQRAAVRRLFSFAVVRQIAFDCAI